ncbi:3-hydroxybutyryl-CoA dehydrogenase [Vulcanibacillus modesticaldus]|uniref:3-hydroxybutyryl-CoA dehydrogenase n=1 Tax=Vulcanibacillus modesticaldus TaxID=337097 RepID=A0A1D2YTP9_9BACI|nr:3-hydroxyacyl-CoA dehydrogenase NAD-binding domain-containing protein [Vulcanibacillus modesticaldus]OEF99059.1 3-hydroxybutyryl-CoA dehydrogenase [Vulcanibacillus modesticaldus]
MPIRKVGVIGAGVMGLGITQVLAERGFEVVLVDKDETNIEKAKQHLIHLLDKKIQKWGITEVEKKIILSKIIFTTDKSLLSDVDFIFETVDEILEVKKTLFSELDNICRPDVIFATNTSTLSITEIAAATNRASKFIGLNFTHPVVERQLVQIIRGLKTSDDTYNISKKFVEKIGKTGIQVYEAPGYVTVRLILPLLNDAMNLVVEGVASAEDVDKAMKLGFDFPYGPLEMADRMGLDAVLRVTEGLYKEYGDVKYRPALILRKLVRAGHLGEKTGEGFFKYNEVGERIN